MEVSALVQVTDCSASAGRTVAVSSPVSPTLRARVVGATATLVGCGDSRTVIWQVPATLESSTWVAVIVVLPLAIAVTRPFASTVATLSSELSHSTACLAVEGLTSKLSCWVAPTFSSALLGVTAISLGSA